MDERNSYDREVEWTPIRCELGVYLHIMHAVQVPRSKLNG